MTTRSPLPALLAVVALLALLTGCGDGSAGQTGETDPEQVDAVAAPDLGACRQLALADVSAPTNASPVVPCAERHTAETYAVGELPPELDDAGYDSPEVGQFAYDTCSEGLRTFVGADESLTMRTVLSWAWFRPSPKAWEDGARWYRCDVVGGGAQSKELVALPKTARGLLQGRPDDKWLACVEGPSVSGAPKTPCSQPHDWRAVTTIKLGEAADAYPGDRLSEVRSRDFCKRSVQAWLNYPAQFDYGYTWFREPEWDAGNRRSVCWARTTE